MRVSMAVSWLVCAACAAGGVRADDKPDAAKLIVGKWEAARADPGTVPPGTVVEFTKDGKLKVSHKKGDADVTADGTYKLDGGKLRVAVSVDGAERTLDMTITRIAADAMTVKDADGGVVEFKKK